MANSSAISCLYNSRMRVVETFSDADTGDSTITVNSLDTADTTLNATSSPAATKHSRFDKAMSGGAGTIDLTSLPGVTADEIVNGTGLKIQVLKIRNKSTNANKITVSNGASNPYRLDGATTAWTFVLAPGQEYLLYLNGAGDTIGGSNKTIDLAGTAAQVLQVHVVMG